MDSIISGASWLSFGFSSNLALEWPQKCGEERKPPTSSRSRSDDNALTLDPLALARVCPTRAPLPAPAREEDPLPATRSLWSSLPALASRLRRFDALAVGSDFDGTLAAIVDHSDDAAMPPRARAVLVRLARLPAVRVGFFSGREVGDLAKRVGVEPAWYAGVCGLEVRDEARVRRDPPVRGRGVPPALVRALRDWCDEHPGTWVQDKGPAFAVHYRQLPARLQPAFTAGVRRRLAEHRGRVHALPGKKVFEISPRVAVDKGTAITQWLAAGGARARAASVCAVFMGDDVNDETGYPVVRARRGIGVVVARRTTKAEFRVQSPAEAVWFLEWLAAEWEAVLRERRVRGSR